MDRTRSERRKTVAKTRLLTCDFGLQKSTKQTRNANPNPRWTGSMFGVSDCISGTGWRFPLALSDCKRRRLEQVGHG